MKSGMIPVGYMYKLVAAPPSCVVAKNVIDDYSVGRCGGSTSSRFDDNYINYCKHNGYWFFNSPEVIESIASANSIDLASMTLFYYEAYEYEFDQSDGGALTERRFEGEMTFETEVLIPKDSTCVGYDVVEFHGGNNPECSLMSCCGLTTQVSVNSHCLLDTFEQAKDAVQSGVFHNLEPGPYRIFAVYVIAAAKKG